MLEAHLLHELIAIAAGRNPDAVALSCDGETLAYDEVRRTMLQFAGNLVSHGLGRTDRVAIYLEKRFETVLASFGTSAAGGIFVPINPLLKPEQVAYILADCGARVLVTSDDRLAALEEVLVRSPGVRQLVVTGRANGVPAATLNTKYSGRIALTRWSELANECLRPGHRVIDTDVVAILYTSGSTGRPKGVILSHRNMVAGAKSVASYLENHAEDTLLAALPLSFDAGFSQLTTAFHAGARVVLLNVLLPRDVLRAMATERVTGLTAVPPLYMQLAPLEWPASIDQHLRYFANTGGRMPRETLTILRQRAPHAKPFLMYGLTEAFRSTYLPPEEIDRRPDSIGKAIPNAEILVLREDGTPCLPEEPGELVHRGALVGLGYWNDPTKTAERYKPLPVGASGRLAELPSPELAVFSGDTVRQDAEGFLYFIGRRDEMIKTSGYRVSPTEIEELVYSMQLVGECAAFGVEHETLGQAIHLAATPPANATSLDSALLLAQCRLRLPAYMVPAHIEIVTGPLARNPNGKIDRRRISAEVAERRGTRATASDAPPSAAVAHTT